MRGVIFKTSGIALLLLLLPISVTLSGWRWTPGDSFYQLPILYALTQTVTRPWGIVTSLLLLAWLIYIMGWRGKQSIQALFLVVAVVWGGQGITWSIKHCFQEPRPYTLWMIDSSPTNGDAFYHLSPKQRGAQVWQTTKDWHPLPEWQRRHWMHETGYAFPSGHSMFVSCWLLLIVGLINVRKHLCSTILLVLWALLVLWSRLALGMHWPRDLMVAILVAWCWNLLVMALMVRFWPLKLSKNE